MRIIKLMQSLRLALSAIVLAVVASCAETDVFEQPQLNVSAQEISFSNQMEEQTLTVTTNCKTWMATSPKAWIHLLQKGNEVTVRVDANPTGLERTGFVLVDGGLAVRKVMVKQSAAALSLDAVKGEVVLPQAGGTTLVDINAGSGGYDLSSLEAQPWLQVIAKKRALKLVAQPNYSNVERTLKFTLSLGAQQREVVVKQPGVSTFVFACNPGTPFSLHKMMDYEYRRGSLLTEYGAPDPVGKIYEESYFFRTSSPLFKDVVYVHDTQTFAATRIYSRSLTQEGVDAVKSAAFQEFAKNNGYVRDEKDTNHYVNERERFTMDVDINAENHSVVLFFNPLQVQEQAYETFKHLDLGPLALLNKADKKRVAVEDYEKAQNSTETRREISHSRELEALIYKTTDPTLVARIYYFYTRGGDTPAPQGMAGSVEQYSLCYSRPSLGLWQKGREWAVTREFDQLLKANGFEFVAYTGQHHVYARRSDFLTLAISGGKFSDVNNGLPVLQIGVLYKPTVFEGTKQERAAKVASLFQQSQPKQSR